MNRTVWMKRQMMQSTVHVAIGLAVCESCSCRSTCRALSVIYKQEMQTTFNNLFGRRQTRHKSWSYLQHLPWHAVRCSIYYTYYMRKRKKVQLSVWVMFSVKLPVLRNYRALGHPTHSSDMTPSDYHPFASLNKISAATDLKMMAKWKQKWRDDW